MGVQHGLYTAQLISTFLLDRRPIQSGLHEPLISDPCPLRRMAAMRGLSCRGAASDAHKDEKHQRGHRLFGKYLPDVAAAGGEKCTNHNCNRRKQYHVHPKRVRERLRREGCLERGVGERAS